ncbi:hypothetical protein HDU67_000406 [Dinochytrium kinnereticum]|nr:hypothetical protein HDU67_000406 [Dinochytrium kinnereticum]
MEASHPTPPMPSGQPQQQVRYRPSNAPSPSPPPPPTSSISIVVEKVPQKSRSNEAIRRSYEAMHGVTPYSTGLRSIGQPLQSTSTVAALHDNWEHKLSKPKPSAWSKAFGFVRSFLTIVTSDGSRVGIDSADPSVQQREEESIMREKSKNPLSIWKIMSKSSPSREELEEHVKKNSAAFGKRYGHHILLERASEGETILHYALLRKQEDIVLYLLEQKDIIHHLVNLVYEGKRYWGEHAAHIAAVVFGDDPTWIQRLIQVGADVHTPRSVGSFFSKTGPLYMGETVLAFAACLNHHKIVSYLINDVGMDPNITDHYGNNVLHVLAWWGGYSEAPPKTIEDLRREDIEKAKEEMGSDYKVDPEISTIEEKNLLERIFKDAPEVIPSSINQYDDESAAPADDDDEKRDTYVTQMYHYLAKMKHEVRSQEEFKALSHDDRKQYLNDLKLKADDSLFNNEGLTPFIVAVQNRKVEMVQALLKFKAILNWEYGPIRQERHCLSEIDTFVEKETMNHLKGALEVAIENNDIKMINLPIFLKLLEAKWKLYGKTIFFSRFCVSLFYLLLLSVAIGLLPNDLTFYNVPGNQLNPAGRPSRLNYFDLKECRTSLVDSPIPEAVPTPPAALAENSTIEGLATQMAQGAAEKVTSIVTCNYSIVPLIRFFVEVFLVLANIMAVIREFIEITSSKMKYFRGFGALENMFQWVNISVFFSVVIFRFLPYEWNYVVENTLLGIAAIFGWISLLYFSKGDRNLGPLVVIFFKIITTDLIWFSLLIAVFVIGFSEALYLQMAPYADYLRVTAKGENAGLEDWRWLGGGFVWGVRYIFGQGSYDDLRNSEIAPFTLILFLISVLSITILLLNVFIAMLNNTFAMIFNESEKQWRMTWANLIMEMDEKILASYRLRYQTRKGGAAPSRDNNKGTIQPITRIGIPRVATVVKPQKRIDEDNSKAQDLSGHTATTAASTTAPKEEKKGSSEWNGYIYDFVLEFKKGVDRPVRMFASFDETSPLYGETSVATFKKGKVKNRRGDE